MTQDLITNVIANDQRKDLVFGMRKALQIFAPLVMGALLLNGTSAIAAVKAGGVCTKAGAISIFGGKKYTCIKSGSRLVWNKGVEIKSASKPKTTPTTTSMPTPASNNGVTPIPTPTATPTLRQLWGSLSSDSLEVWDIIKPIPTDLVGAGLKNITYAFSSDIPLDSQEELKRQYRLTTTYWSRFTSVNQKLHVAVSKTGDVKFLCTERAKYIRTNIEGCVQYNPGPIIGAYTMFDDGTGTFNWMTVNPDLRSFGTHEGWTSHHEYVHSVQYSVNKRHWESHPCWFEEGMAMLFSPAIYSEGKLGLYLRLRNQQASQQVGAWRVVVPRGTSPSVEDWSNWLWRATVTKYDKAQPGVDGCSNYSGASNETGIYEVGLLGVEKIIHKVGMAGLFKLMTLTGESGWESAVNVVFGITAKDLNLEIARVIHQESSIARNNFNMIQNFCVYNPKDPDC